LGYDFAGPTRFEKLFTGTAVARPAWIQPGDVRGTNHIGLNDTPDVTTDSCSTGRTHELWRP
jgi:hypothetical protein